MSNINQINNTSMTQAQPESTGGRSAAGSGAIATIDNLIAMLQKMNSEIRDMQRDHFTAQQSSAHQKDLIALGNKERAIELNYESAVKSGKSKIISGGLGVGGALLGGLAPAGVGTFISSGAEGIGKIGEGNAAVGSAGLTREAQEVQLLADYQSNAASEYWKGLSATVEKAAEASRRMIDLTRELMSLQERIMGAVRM